MPTKIPARCFTGIVKIMENLYRQAEELEKPKQTWKRIKWEESFYPILRLTMAPLVKTVWCSQRDRHIDERNKRKNPETASQK